MTNPTPRRPLRAGLIVAAFALGLMLLGAVAASVTATPGGRNAGLASRPIYWAPRPGARLVRPATTLSLRFDIDVDPLTVGAVSFHIEGELSGPQHAAPRLAADGRTLIVTPLEAFALGERVTVTIAGDLRAVDGAPLGVDPYDFWVTSGTRPDALTAVAALFPAAASDGAGPSSAPEPPYKTVPIDFPALTVTVPASGTGEGFIFLSNFTIDWEANDFSVSRPYLLILDNEGEPVFYRRMHPQLPFTDFKKQPGGELTYAVWAGPHAVLDDSYNIVEVIRAGNGYDNDLHDLHILPNDHVMLMIYDPQPVDMSVVVPGGDPNATVIGLVLQELDSARDVVFEWRSWDHFAITDTAVNLLSPVVDYVHANSIELDFDGNWLVSNRSLNEVTKISRQTGDVIWRLGGKRNQFQFVDDPKGQFYGQHDARRQADGHITIFDNRFGAPEAVSFPRVAEYKLDIPNMTATLVWSYTSPISLTRPLVMGNAQRLPNGNTVIGWGSFYPSLTEVTPAGDVVFEMSFDPPTDTSRTRNSYRAFRFPWVGHPTAPASLVAEPAGLGRTTLSFSWNGATDVVSYTISGGRAPSETGPVEMAPIATVARTGFEDRHTVLDPLGAYCIFQVTPWRASGEPGVTSGPVFADWCRQDTYLPAFRREGPAGG